MGSMLQKVTNCKPKDDTRRRKSQKRVQAQALTHSRHPGPYKQRKLNRNGED